MQLKKSADEVEAELRAENAVLGDEVRRLQDDRVAMLKVVEESVKPRRRRLLWLAIGAILSFAFGTKQGRAQMQQLRMRWRAEPGWVR